jgi:hypothetical protein
MVAGCGDGGGGDSTTPRAAETADPPAKLPAGWRTETNRPAGFTVGVPPAWSANLDGSTSVLRSPDRLVAISVSADRTDEALDAPLEGFATATAEGLGGFEDLKLGSSRPFEGAAYPGVEIAGSGRQSETGVPQRVELVILRREGIASYPVLAAINDRRSSPFVEQIDRIVRSLRGRPVEVS